MLQTHPWLASFLSAQKSLLVVSKTHPNQNHSKDAKKQIYISSQCKVVHKNQDLQKNESWCPVQKINGSISGWEFIFLSQHLRRLPATIYRVLAQGACQPRIGQMSTSRNSKRAYPHIADVCQKTCFFFPGRLLPP